MSTAMRKIRVILAAVALLAIASVSSRAADELGKRATWSIPATADVKAKLDDYLATKTLDEAAKLKIDALWSDEALALEGSERLERLTASLAVVDAKAALVVAACQQEITTLPPPTETNGGICRSAR